MSCYVALGDSLTCGTGDGCWPDEVAVALGPGVRYANLATVGATSRDVEEEQLEPGLSLRPDLVTLICGANDVLASVRPDAGSYAARLGRMLDRIRAVAPGAVVVTATYPDLSRVLELRERTAARVRRGVAQFNEACRSVASRHGVLLIEWAEHPGAADPGYLGADGFHPSTEGHRVAARDVLDALAARVPTPTP